MSNTILKKSAVALALTLAFSGYAAAEAHIAVVNQDSSEAVESGNNMYIEQGGFLNWAYADQYGEGNDTFLLQLDSLQEAYAYVTGNFNLVEVSSMASGTP